MTDFPQNSPLDFGDVADLWQSEQGIPADTLIARLYAQNNRLRRINQVSFVICAVALIATAFIELVGQIPTRGLLTLVGALSFIGSAWKYRRDKARLIAAYSEEPKKLLPFLIARTKAARNVARYYYTLPLPSCALGFMAGRLSEDESEPIVSIAVFMPIVLLAFFGLVALTVWGLRMARQKTEELRDLEAMLEKI